MMMTVIIHHLLHTYVSTDCNIEKIAELNVCEVQQNSLEGIIKFQVTKVGNTLAVYKTDCKDCLNIVVGESVPW